MSEVLTSKYGSSACTASGTKKAARKLYVLRLPRERQPRPSGGHARRSSSRKLCVLRLPRESQPGNSMYCACHEKGSRGPAAATRAAAPPGGSVYCACQAEVSLLFSPSFSPPSFFIFLQQNRPGFQRGALGCTIPLTVGMQFPHKLFVILGRACSLTVRNTHNQLVCSTPRSMLQIGLLLAT